MKKKQISLLLIGALLASVSVAAEKTQKKKVEVIPASTATKIVVTPWEPIAFDQKADRLQPNYLGLDPVKFLEMFKSKVESLNKGEFETSEEFTKRTANLDALLSPINTTDTYAFRISKIPFKYDADEQIYLIGEKHEYSCQKTYSSVKSKDWVTCPVSFISREKDKYVGTNAYGASVTISRTHGRDFAIAIANDSAVLRTFFTQDLNRNTEYFFQDRLSVPLEKARDLKDMKIAVLFVGRITDAKIIEGRETLVTPKIDLPIDLFITEEAIPFELKKVIYYVIQTGEVLGQRFFK